MPHMISLRAVTITSTLGHTVAFERMKATYVPPPVVPLALAQGCALCTEKGELIDILAETALLEAKPVAPKIELDEEDPDAIQLEAASAAAARETIEEAPEVKTTLTVSEPTDPKIRHALIRDAYDEVLRSGDTRMLRRNGKPKVGAVSLRLGWQVKLGELADATGGAA